MDYRKLLLVSTLAGLVLGFSPAQNARAQGFWDTTDPPTDSVNFFGSGQFVCQFDRRDRPDDADVTISGPSIHQPGLLDPIKIDPVALTGLAACGLPDSNGSLTNYGLFTVNINFGCVTRTVNGNIINYKESFGDSCATPLVTGSLVGTGEFVNDPTALNTACGGTLSGCTLNIGIESGINANTFQTKVCPKDPDVGLTNDGDIFAFRETLVAGGQIRPGKIGACYCNSHLGGGEVDCGSGNNVKPQNVTTSGATFCTFDWRKTQDTINISGSPNQIPAAIYDSPECPVTQINTSTVRVCNDVKPRNFKLQTVSGKTALTMQIPEGTCAASLNVTTGGVIIDIDVEGAFNDQTRFEGSDDVTTVTQ